jgi:hypothetical protein
MKSCSGLDPTSRGTACDLSYDFAEVHRLTHRWEKRGDNERSDS